MRRGALAGLAITALLSAAGSAQAAFPGGNGRIAFQGANGLASMNAAGSDRQPLADQGMSTFATPAYSADGQRVAFAGQAGSDFDIFTVGAAGGTVAQLTLDASEDGAPSWSPDGRRIVFESEREGQSQIYVMNADGSGATRLTFDVREDRSPSWSPDGSRIAFARGPVGDPADIWVMGADGSSPTPLTSDPADEGNPDWSPDGARIAFQRGGGIVVMGAGGTPQTPLALPAGAARPAWAPDGSRIAFDDGAQIFTVSPDSGGVTQLTTAGAPALIARAPSWQPIPLPPGSGPPAPPGGPTAPATRSLPLLKRKAVAKLTTRQSYSSFTALTVKPVRKGDTLRLTCAGRGCPLDRVTIKVKRDRRRLSLLDRLAGAKLRKGAVVKLRVTRAGAVGRLTTWRIRPPKPPLATRRCLVPGKRKPTRC